MEDLCYDIDYVSTDGESPAALGNRIAATVIERGREDGSLEETRYADTDYKPVNAPLVVSESGAKMRDPDRWQPLALAQIVAQNGLPIPGKVQSFIGPHWGHVASFALPESADGLPIDPGPAPHLGDRVDEPYKQTALDVIRRSSQLDPARRGDGRHRARRSRRQLAGDERRRTGTTRTRQPGSRIRPTASCAATTHARWRSSGPTVPSPRRRPVTGTPWRTRSPTHPASCGASAAAARSSSRLEWDVKLYLALNGAVHDAAIAAWGVKGFYDSARPISMIRYMGGRGQSSDPSGPAYDPRGLPLAPGLVEVITAESSAPGGRHAHLAGHRGEIAIKAWRGNPEDPETQTGGVGWILAVDWLPYQLPTFVTPAFRRVRLRPQHVQPRGSRGADGVHRRPVLPGRRVRVARACR